MNKIHSAVFSGLVVVTAMVLLCSRNPAEAPLIINGDDSLSIQQIAQLDPVTADERLRLRNVGIRLLCAGELPEKNGDTTIAQFAERLLLVSGTEWNGTAAALLLSASIKLYHATSSRSCTQVQEYRDTLATKLAAIVQSPSIAVALPSIPCDQMSVAGRDSTVLILQTILGVSLELAGLIAEFITIPEDTASFSAKEDMKSIVSGLVAKKGDIAKSAAGSERQARSPATSVHRSVPPKDNSVEVLRYRNQESIRDSIQKHIPDLRQLYKKSLKSGDAFSGQVLVTIRVNAAGEVVQTAIKATDINNKLFLDPFVRYIHTIRFKPVAKKLGAMTFDFPFEFSAEM